MSSRITHNPQSITHHRRGLGILETIVAFSILITGIVTLMALVIAGSVGRQSNENQTVAVNLAREGVEAVISARNDNWINGSLFDAAIYTGTDYTFIPVFDPALVSWSFDGNANIVTDELAKVYKYSSGTNAGLFVQSASPPVGSLYSGFNRLVETDPICYESSTDTETVITSGTCGTTPGIIGLRVTSTIRWTEHSGPHTISVVENLYDWR